MDKTRQFEDLFLWRALVWLIRVVLVISSVAAVLTIVLGVLMRYVFKSHLYGVEELITLFAMWLYFIGGIHGSYEDSHIKADVLNTLIRSAKIQAGLRIFMTGLCLICSLFFAVWGIQYFLWSVKLGGYSVSLHIPMILSKIPLCICLVLMVFYNIYHFINAILGRVPPKNRKQPPAEREVYEP